MYARRDPMKFPFPFIVPDVIVVEDRRRRQRLRFSVGHSRRNATSPLPSRRGVTSRFHVATADSAPVVKRGRARARAHSLPRRVHTGT